jgi:hypothetical protein
MTGITGRGPSRFVAAFGGHIRPVAVTDRHCISEWLAAGIAMAAMSRLYRASLLSSAFGCVFAPILITAGSCLLLPTAVTLGVVCVFVVILAIPARPRPPIVNRILRDATDTAREYFNITIKHDAAKFQRPGPYVIGDVHAWLRTSADVLSARHHNLTVHSTQQHSTPNGACDLSQTPGLPPSIL